MRTWLFIFVSAAVLVATFAFAAGCNTEVEPEVITHADADCQEDEVLAWTGNFPNDGWYECAALDDLLDLEQQRLADLVRRYARELFEVNQELVDAQHALVECQEEVSMER